MGEENKIIAAIAIGACLLLFMALTLVLFFFLTKKKLIQKELEKKSMELAYQDRVIQSAILAQEDERRRIAQDLHDAISAKLNVISLTTHVLQADDKVTPKQNNALQHILNVTDKTLENSRKLAHNLLPPTLEKFGLVPALEELFEEFTETSDLTITHNIDHLPFLDKSKEVHVFRIIQELINNAIRHGKADHLNIQIHSNAESYTIVFKDNGVGFDVSAVKKESGIGLQNIKSRATILNGALHMESVQHQGSTFTINCDIHG